MPQKINLTSLLVLTRWPALALSVVWLSGCAYAPGLSIGKGLQATQEQGNPYSITTKRASVPSAPSGGQLAVSGEPAPSGALLSITPELIRQQRALKKNTLGTDVERLFGEARPYAIGSSDVVDIVVWNHPELALTSAGFNVSPDGMIQYPLIGNFKISGLTETQAAEQITRRLAKYINNPQVTLRVQAYRAGRVYVDGEVRTPGLQAINDIPMSLPEAISRAGGLTSAADRATVAISRNGITTRINLPQLTEQGINPSRIMLAAGDMVRVASRDDAKVYVMGEVSRPMALPLNNGRLTLNEALGESGGVNPVSGDPRQIYVVRSRKGDASTADATLPEIYHLNAKSPAAYALAEGFELQSRDVVFVDPVPLVLWNRVISLILPSAQAVASASSSLK
jgi:polysaccharide export outer membrane protein